MSFRLFELAKFPKDMPNDHANGHREIEEAAAMKHLKKLRGPVTIGILATVLFLASPAMTEESSIVCNRTVKVQVVALDQPWMWNRLGAAQPGGMIYALYGDVVKMTGMEANYLIPIICRLTSVRRRLRNWPATYDCATISELVRWSCEPTRGTALR